MIFMIWLLFIAGQECISMIDYGSGIYQPGFSRKRKCPRLWRYGPDGLSLASAVTIVDVMKQALNL